MRIVIGAAFGALLALTVIGGPAQAAGQHKECKATEIAAFQDRVHVFCKKPPGMGAVEASLGKIIEYFAVATNDPLADKLILLARESLVNGRPVTVWFDDDPAFNPPGCGAGDCRRLTGIQVN